MHSTTVIGYHYDGAAYCEDCFLEPHPQEMEAYGAVVFGEHEYDFIGSTCDGCRACYGPQGWSEPNCDARQWRWTRCPACNSQLPYDRSDADSRLLALQNKLECRSCSQPTHF